MRRAVESLAVPLSHTMLASYEKGTAAPAINVLAALADRYGRPINWFLETRETLSGFRYRNLRSRVGVKDRRQFEAVAAKWVDGLLNLERHLRETMKVRGVEVGDGADPREVASRVRAELKLDDADPVLDVIEVLEHFGIRVLEVETDLSIDGVAARHGELFVVVLNPATSNDRLRLNAGHELAHVLYDDCKNSAGLKDDEVEKRAYDFASCLLLPDSQLKEAFDGKSFIKLRKYKERFGISIAAMVYRAEKRKIINSSTARRLWVEMSKRGWKKAEPGNVWRDRAMRFEVMLESAIRTRAITWKEAERVTGITEDDLRTRLNRVTFVGAEEGQEEATETKGGADEEATILAFPHGNT